MLGLPGKQLHDQWRRHVACHVVGHVVSICRRAAARVFVIVELLSWTARSCWRSPEATWRAQRQPTAMQATLGDTV